MNRHYYSFIHIYSRLFDCKTDLRSGKKRLIEIVSVNIKYIYFETLTESKPRFKTHDIKVMVVVFNAVFNHISVISWQSVLLVEEIGVPGEIHRPTASHWQTLSCTIIKYSSNAIVNAASYISFRPLFIEVADTDRCFCHSFYERAWTFV